MKKIIISLIWALPLVSVAQTAATASLHFWQDRTFQLLIGGALILIIILIVKKIIDHRTSNEEETNYENSNQQPEL